jgi:hypothetical protein
MLVDTNVINVLSNISSAPVDKSYFFTSEQIYRETDGYDTAFFYFFIKLA